MLRNIDFEFFCRRKLRLGNAKVLTFKTEKLRLAHLLTTNMYYIDQKLAISRGSTTKQGTKKKHIH